MKAVMPAMRVLHVIPSMSRVHGGPTYALEMMERSLTAAGAEVTVATTDDDGPGHRLALRSAVRSDTGDRYYGRKWTEFYKISPSLLLWLVRNCGRFDVIHIHSLFSFSSVAAALAARLRGVPYIVRPLGTLNVYGITQRRPLLKSLSTRLIERPILANASAVHFTSQAEWDEAMETGIPMRGVVVPLGANGPEPADKSGLPFAVDGDRKIILFLSRLDPKKNVEGLLRAFAIVRDNHPDALLVIAGDGARAYVRELKSLASNLGIDSAIVWTGHIEGSKKWGVLMHADVFILPSFSENFGIAAAEAIIAGRPCIVGRDVALASTILKGGAGLVTEPVPKEIARNINLLLDDSALRTDLANGAAALAKEFSPATMAARLMVVYRRIVENASKSKSAITSK